MGKMTLSSVLGKCHSVTPSIFVCCQNVIKLIYIDITVNISMTQMVVVDKERKVQREIKEFKVMKNNGGHSDI